MATRKKVEPIKHIKIKEKIPFGAEITIRAFVRNYENKGFAQIFGVVTGGIKNIDIPPNGTVVIRGNFIITDGEKEVDTEKWNDWQSNDELMRDNKGF